MFMNMYLVCNIKHEYFELFAIIKTIISSIFWIKNAKLLEMQIIVDKIFPVSIWKTKHNFSSQEKLYEWKHGLSFSCYDLISNLIVAKISFLYLHAIHSNLKNPISSMQMRILKRITVTCFKLIIQI